MKKDLQNFTVEELKQKKFQDTKDQMKEAVYQELLKRKQEIDKKEEEDERMARMEENQKINKSNEVLNIHQHQLVRSVNEYTRFYVLQLDQRELKGIQTVSSEDGHYENHKRHMIRYLSEQQKIPLSLQAFKRLKMSQEIEEQAANIIIFVKIVDSDSIFGAYELSSNDLKTWLIQVSDEIRLHQSSNISPEWSFMSNKPLIGVFQAR